MNNVIIENGWESKLSSYKREDNKKIPRKIKIYGRYVHHQAIFEYSLSHQESGAYCLRGSVRVIDNSGNVLKLTGKKARDILSKIPEKDRRMNHPKLDIRANVYTNSLDDEDIKKRISEAVIKLYNDNSIRINEHLNIGARPDTITANIAAQLGCGSYLGSTHPDASQEYRIKLEKRIKNLCAKLPIIPMKDVRKVDIRNWAQKNAISDEALNELCKFWDYCIASGTCGGKNPIDKPKKHKKKKGENGQYASVRRTALDKTEEENLIKVLGNVDNEFAAAVALMASGFEPSFISRLKCLNVELMKNDEDHVLIHVRNDNFATATKDYSRPMDPRYALIVRKHLKKIQEENNGEKIDDLFFIRNPKSKSKSIDPSRIVKEATRLLHVAGVSHTTIAYLREDDKMVAAATKLLKNTHHENIIKRCNLESDSGTYSFLLGKSFGGDVTSDSYTSFTCPAGEKRLYKILKVLSSLKTLRDNPPDFDDGRNVIKIRKPKTNKDLQDCTIEIVLCPGEEMRIDCEHGLYGEFTSEVIEVKEEQISLWDK